MPKNIVVCCDGTANEFAKDNTNVVELYSTLLYDEHQRTYYHPGVGTMEPPGALTPLRQRFARLIGLTLGAFLENDIRDAYVFLMNTFESNDRVFLFGFSRGAYTVRAVASLLHMYGLLRPGNEPVVPYVIRMMTAIQRADQSDAAAREKRTDYFDLAAEFKRAMSQECCPWFIGLWDTVSSVGWIENPLHLPYTSDNPDIQFGRHAVVLDEQRAFFRTNLWRLATDPNRSHGPQDLLQVWFPGVHCDVGGGYPEAESGLSKIALKWMLDEATAPKVGLLVDAKKRAEILGETSAKYVQPDPHAVAHESLNGFWPAAEFVPKRHFNWSTKKEERRMNLFRRRATPTTRVARTRRASGGASTDRKYTRSPRCQCEECDW